jgi:hypothetical protein
MVKHSDVIVLAIAREFVPNPYVGVTTRIPDVYGGHVRFEIAETLVGQVRAKQSPLMIRGSFSARDDFNDTPVPENWVRGQGRGGDCFASTYRRDATYLLMLKTASAGRLTPYWVALGRVNDQVRPEGDPWVSWVRREVLQRRARRW